MNTWLKYERQRNVFERKYAPIVLKALNKQLYAYTRSLKAGRPDLEIFTTFELAGVLLGIYRNVGPHFAREQYRELRKEARGNKRRQSYAGLYERVGAKSYHGGSIENRQRNISQLQLKRGSFGFSLEWAEKIISILRLTALDLAQKISNFTRTKVLLLLEQAQRENLSLDETVQLITEEVTEFNRKRAESITRTEVGRAATEGKMQGAKALGVELDKVWISARDNRTRTNPKREPSKGDHWVLNGQRRAMEEPFDNGTHKLMQPGDIKAPPAETIRCRCTVVFKVKKDPDGSPIRREYI